MTFDEFMQDRRRVDENHNTEELATIAIESQQTPPVPLWIVSYDTNGDEILNAIQGYNQAKLTNSCYVIESNESFENIVLAFQEVTSEGDHISICPFILPLRARMAMDDIAFFQDRFQVEFPESEPDL